MQYIVTHPGQAHRDEFLAIAVAFSIHGEMAVHRREPTAEELANPEVLVLDVGGRHEPELSNFDHHQRGREEKPECALSLYAQHVGLAEVLGIRKWYAPTVQMDVQGPFATAKTLGLPRFPFELSGPIEGQLLHALEEAAEVLPGSTLSQVLVLVGIGMVESAKEFVAKLNALATVVSSITVNGIQCLVFETTDTTGTQDLRDRDYPDAAVALSWDDRGAGWSLYRYNDHPSVDFSVLEGDSAVLFAHKGGFIAKTHARLGLDEVLALVERSVR